MPQPATPSPASQAPPPPARPRRKRRAWIWVLLGGILLASGAAAIVFVPKYLKGSVQGTLVSLTRQAPIADARIRCLGRTVTTDESGRFELRRLTPGSIPVTVTVAGFPSFRTTLDVKMFSTTAKRLTLPDASLTVAVREIASQPATVTGPTVLVGGANVLPNAGGVYELRGLPPTGTVVRVSGPDHETTETTTELSPGSNNLEVRLSLTPKATLMRYYHAFEVRDWKAAYAYLHPDAAKREPFSAFEKDMENWGTMSSLDVSNVTMHPRWISPSTGKTYANVAAMTRRLTGKSRGGLYTSTATQHWARVKGVWLRVDVR